MLSWKVLKEIFESIKKVWTCNVLLDNYYYYYFAEAHFDERKQLLFTAASRNNKITIQFLPWAVQGWISIACCAGRICRWITRVRRRHGVISSAKLATTINKRIAREGNAMFGNGRQFLTRWSSKDGLLVKKTDQARVRFAHHRFRTTRVKGLYSTQNLKLNFNSLVY